MRAERQPQLIALDWPGMSSERSRQEFCPLREVTLRGGLRTRNIVVTCRITGRHCDHANTRRLPDHCPLLGGLTLSLAPN